VVAALLSRARHARGCCTPGDDRLETRAYAVKRYLFRLGHAQRSARFACSIEQLVIGLAPVMGWTTQPGSERDRGRFVRAHRKSVQRWLDDLQAAGLVAHEPERDGRGCWWRTQIVLLVAPEPIRGEMECARTRARGWRRRERARRSAGCGARSRLAAIRARAILPSASTRRRVAMARRAALAQRRRDARVDGELEHRRAVSTSCGVLTHPVGAAPSAPRLSGHPKRSKRPGTPESVVLAAPLSAQTSRVDEAFVAQTGARDVGASAQAAWRSDAQTAGSEEVGCGRGGESLIERVARREAAGAARRRLVREHAERRAFEVVRWSVGTPCPPGRLLEAWTLYRYGSATVADSGRACAGGFGASLARLVRDAVRRYEEHADERPPGWPASGAGALCALASQGVAATLAGDAARLQILASCMRAIARERDPQRVPRAVLRVQHAESRQRRTGFAFRHEGRWETTEQRRQRVRRAVLAAGCDPAGWPNAALASDWLPTSPDRPRAPELIEPDDHAALDGVGARAHRYRSELDAGRWDLLPSWHQPDPYPGTKEAP
jgi:hypothetical protein